MAELSTQERLQPSLLDRLIDDAPHERQESRDKRVLSLKRLREGVLRDVVWLLNTTSYVPAADLEPFPEVARSVLNFGLPDVTGKRFVGLDLPRLERQLRQALWNYEPRLLRDSVKVRVASAAEKMNKSAVVFEIEAQLWAEPAPVRLYMKTEVDLESGSFQTVDVV